jgi:hypothetical protein
MMKRFCLYALTAFVIFGCKKKDEPLSPDPANTNLQQGLPDKYKSINGYMIAIHQKDYIYSTNMRPIECYAAFNDPATNLIASYDHLDAGFTIFSFLPQAGNISVGPIWFGPDLIYPTTQNKRAFYHASISKTDSDPVNASWSTEGNGSFKPFSQNVARGFPQLGEALTAASISISVGQGYSLNPAKIGISNYDSLLVRINGNTILGQSCIKRVGPGAPAVFTAADLSIFGPGTYAKILIGAFNYSHRMVEGKLYVFETASHVLRQAEFTP